MSLVTVTLLHYTPRARFRAFANMGRFLLQPLRADGLRFAKLLGSGINFGMVPDLSTYVFLGVWDAENQARTFFQTTCWQTYQRGTDRTGTLYLAPQKAHGLWDGQRPFPVDSLTTRPEMSPQDPSLLTAVLTRATIRTAALPDFWRHVPQARQRLRDHADQLLFAIGVGEKPLVQQCTISVWRDAAAVNQYAYRDSGHREVVQLTRQRNWYAEEMFARFRVLKAEGEAVAAVWEAMATTLV